ncbi:unnamed protein product [Urochloa humidicola]
MPALIAGRHSALLRRCAAGGDLSLSRSSTLRPWLVGAFRTAPWIPYRPRAALLPLWGAPPRPPGVRWNALALHARLLALQKQGDIQLPCYVLSPDSLSGSCPVSR